MLVTRTHTSHQSLKINIKIFHEETHKHPISCKTLKECVCACVCVCVCVCVCMYVCVETEELKLGRRHTYLAAAIFLSTTVTEERTKLGVSNIVTLGLGGEIFLLTAAGR